MGIIVDLIIVLIICLCAFLGYKKGLAKCLLQICTTVLALIIAFVLYKPFVNFMINNTTIDDNIQLSLERAMGSSTEQNASEGTQLVKEDSGIPKPIVEYLNNNVKGAIEDNKSSIISSTARDATILIVDVVGLIIIYIIAKLLLRIITVLTDIVTKLPLIKQCSWGNHIWINSRCIYCINCIDINISNNTVDRKLLSSEFNIRVTLG